MQCFFDPGWRLPSNQRLQQLLQAGPKALAAAKNLIRSLDARPLEAVRQLTIETIAELRTSAEGQEGLKAFLEKRKPDWLG